MGWGWILKRKFTDEGCAAGNGTQMTFAMKDGTQS